ncbi:hypothetical protein ACFRI7_07155 [Streptomyces sp. NPDC056716]|uniref:hypothetical protein n=1 Tax=unclassified Streptomyces TaxID=2593676 RepID=UPI0036A40305
MSPLPRPTADASPASGVLRGLRAGVLATLCVLLPLVGHVLARCHAPGWVIVGAVAVVAVPGAVLLTRRRLTDAQVIGVLVAAQLASHVAYALAAAEGTVTSGGVLVEHGADAGPPAGVLLAGHLVGVVIAARLLGVSERLLWQWQSGGPVLAAVHRLLVFVWPRLGPGYGTGPRVAISEDTTPLRSASPVRRASGRAPPRFGCVDLAPFRPLSMGGPRLP